MDRSHATTVIDRAVPAANPQPATDAGGQPRQSRLTRGQRWLAGATAVAVLLSGLNASVQVLKAVLDHRGQPVAQRPHPGITGKLFHHVTSPAALRGPGCASRAVTMPGLEQRSSLFLFFSNHMVRFCP